MTESTGYRAARDQPPTHPTSPPLAHSVFDDPSASEIYTLSLHDALPICNHSPAAGAPPLPALPLARRTGRGGARGAGARSEEHTSELQTHVNIVCHLPREKKKSGQLRRRQCHTHRPSATTQGRTLRRARL